MSQDSNIPCVRLDGETFKPRSSNSVKSFAGRANQTGASERGLWHTFWTGWVNPCRKDTMQGHKRAIQLALCLDVEEGRKEEKCHA